MLARNEWDPLQHVIVGRADGACIPKMDVSLRTINYSHLDNVDEVPYGLYPQQVIDEANQDLDGLCNFLRDLGVTVSRPGHFPAPEYYYYCPRDSIFVHDDLVVETPMPLRARRHESRVFEHVFERVNHRFRWLKIQAQRRDDLYNIRCVGDPDQLALTEVEPAFDAANMIRANDDVFYLVSNSANERGAAMMQELLGSQRRVWPIKGIYSYMHIDSTISFLREGLMVLNPSRIRSLDQLPKPLQSWDVIWAPDPGEVWHYPGYCNSSRWASMNIFSVRPDLVLIERDQESLAQLIRPYGIECAMLPMRHARTLGGSFHCVTLDVERKHD